MTIEQEIKELFSKMCFAYDVNCLYGLKTTQNSYTYKNNEEIGVAIIIGKDIELNESATNINFYTKQDLTNNYLFLTTTGFNQLDTFATICSSLVKFEQDLTFLSNPILWWDEWKSILGNTIIEKTIFDILGEMVALRELLKRGLSVTWDGVSSKSSHDISSSITDFEVKSTTVKYRTEVTISSHFQMETFDKELRLIICRFEEASHGLTINSLCSELISLGYCPIELESILTSSGYEKGSRNRNRPYVLLEMLEYMVDDTFPKITAHSFIEGKLPNSITKLKYTIDLSNVPHMKIV